MLSLSAIYLRKEEQHKNGFRTACGGRSNTEPDSSEHRIKSQTKTASKTTKQATKVALGYYLLREFVLHIPCLAIPGPRTGGFSCYCSVIISTTFSAQCYLPFLGSRPIFHCFQETSLPGHSGRTAQSESGFTCKCKERRVLRIVSFFG